MNPKEEVKMKTLMNIMKGARVPIERKGQNFIVEVKVQKENIAQEEGFIAPRKVATKRWAKKMDVDEGKLQTKNRWGTLAVEDEKYDDNSASVFPGQGWGM